MKTILVLSPHPEIADSIRAGLNPTQYRIIHRTGEAEAEPMLAHGLVQGVILDVEFNGVQNMWVVERLRRRDARCPIIIYTGAKQSEWEEEAYLRGVSHVLAKPVRPRASRPCWSGFFSWRKSAQPELFAGRSTPQPGAACGGQRRDRRATPDDFTQFLFNPDPLA